MSRREIVDYFKVGRRYTNPKSESLSIEITEQSSFFTGFNFKGADASTVDNILNSRAKPYERISFFAGALSHPLNVAKTVWEHKKEVYSIIRNGSIRVSP